MRPIEVVISAFGSFGGEQRISFHMKQGIFLIIGDTGAGKTTIFDAMTYALYGQTSGGKREGNMMRSQFAEDNRTTFVSYTFSNKGKVYTVYRQPEQMRASKRRGKDGEYGFTKESAKVCLTMPDGADFPGKAKETDAKICEIIGLDVGQFTQIAMIAQGDFLRLLHAPSKERKAIFAKIFDTRMCEQVQGELERRFKALYGQLEDNRKLSLHDVEGIRLMDESAFKSMWEEQGSLSVNDNQPLFEILEKIQDEIIDREQVLTEEIDILETNLGKVQTQIQNERNLSKMKENLQNITKQLEDLDGKTAQIEEEWEVSKDMHEKKTPELSEAAVRIEQTFEAYETSEKLKETYKKAKDALEKICTEEMEIAEEWENLCALVKNVSEQIQEREDAQKEYYLCKERMQKEEQSLKVLQDLLMRETVIRRQENICQEKKQVFARNLSVYEEKTEEYETLYKAFIRAQAGIMASSLQEGDVCPVCGSTVHPKLAPKPDRAINQQEVDKAKQNKEDADQELQTSKDALIQAEKTLEQEERLAKEQFDNWKSMAAEKSENLPDTTAESISGEKEQMNWGLLKKCADDSKSRVQEMKNEELTQKRRMEEYGQLQMQWKKYQEKQEELQNKKQQTADKKAKQQLEITALDKELEVAGKQLEYASLSEARIEAEKLRLQAQQYKQRYEKASQEMESHRLNIESLKAQKITSEKNLLQLQKDVQECGGKDWKTVQEMQDYLEEMQNKKGQIEKQARELYSIRVGNETHISNIRKAVREREGLEKEFRIINHLYKTANGKLTGDYPKLNFQTYMQRRYFIKVIKEANKRLRMMSRQQFELRCRDKELLSKQGEAGLDLDVYSPVTGQVRDVKTLSGGESFMAALSMALGMADLIQNYQGSVRLDTMFIDEGFGTLDDESRREAIRILDGLAGDKRLIGIISHVTELKEQIPVRLHVEKGQKGSHAEWVE